MEYKWEDLLKPLVCSTKRGAKLIDLETGKEIRTYTAGTKVKVAQKCVTEEGTFYRPVTVKVSQSYALKAPDLGLPDKTSSTRTSQSEKTLKCKTSSRRTPDSIKKQKVSQKAAPAKSGEPGHRRSFWARLFRKK